MLAIVPIVLLLWLVDLCFLLPQMDSQGFVAAAGYLLLAAVFCGLVTTLVVVAVQLSGRFLLALPLPVGASRVVLAALAAVVPATVVAELVTEGEGISSSVLGKPLYGFIVLLLVGTAVLAARLGPWICSRRFWSRLVALVLLLAGFVVLAITSFQPMTYIRPHRALVLLATLLLTSALALALFSLRRPRPRRLVWRWLVLLTLSTALFGLGALLSRTQNSQRPMVVYEIYNYSLVAQKFLPLLVALSPARSVAQNAANRFELLELPPVPPLGRGKYRDHNVILLTVDALRGDSLGFVAGIENLTPFIDQLAQESVHFTRGITNYSHTTRSIRTFQAGSWEVAYGDGGLDAEQPQHWEARKRMPKLFGSAGYRTMAFMKNDKRFRAETIVGFDVHQRPGHDCRDIVDALAENLEGNLEGNLEAKPFFAWLHVYDTHTKLRYEASDKLFGESKRGKYYAAIHHVDRCVKKMVEHLKEKKLWDRTILFMTADHGEGLGEHRRTLKHSTCYLHDIQVPILIRLPGLSETVQVDYTFQTADFLPTVANLVGIDADGEAFTGRDLSGLMVPLGARSVTNLGWALSEGHALQYPCASVLFEQWHLIYNDRGKHYELYDVSKDPAEKKNLIAEHPDVVDRLTPIVDDHWSRQRK